MKILPLTQGKVALVDDEDFDRISKHKWYAVNCGGKWYARRNARNKDGTKYLEYLHREIINPPPGAVVDHKNGDGFDNRKENLRFGTQRQNNVNQRPYGASGYKGVHKYEKRKSKPYIAHICSAGIRRFLGYFPTAEEAAKAYDKAAKELHGEFAYLNFP